MAAPASKVDVDDLLAEPEENSSDDELSGAEIVSLSEEETYGSGGSLDEMPPVQKSSATETSSSRSGDRTSEKSQDKKGGNKSNKSKQTSTTKNASRKGKQTGSFGKTITSSLAKNYDLGETTSCDRAYLVKVDNPQKKGEGIYGYGQYIAYDVISRRRASTEEKDDDGDSKTQGKVPYGKEVTVSRRYSDFDWLRKELVKRFPGCLIPALPEKAVVGRFTKVFIRDRQDGLQRFLDNLSQHFLLSASPLVRMFLTASTNSLAQHKKAAAQNSKGSSSSGGWWDSLKGSVTSALSNTPVGSFVGASSNLELPKTSATIECERICAYAQALQSQLQDMLNHVDQVISSTITRSSALFKLSVASGTYAKMEGEHQKDLGASYKELGNCVSDVSKLMERMHDKEVGVFRKGLRNLLRQCAALEECMKSREMMLRRFEGRKDEVRQCRARINVLKSQVTKQYEVSEQKALLERLERKTGHAEVSLERVTSLALLEYDRFMREKKSDMIQIMVHYAKTRRNTAEREFKYWDHLVKSATKISRSRFQGQTGPDLKPSKKKSNDERKSESSNQ